MQASATPAALGWSNPPLPGQAGLCPTSSPPQTSRISKSGLIWGLSKACCKKFNGRRGAICWFNTMITDPYGALTSAIIIITPVIPSAHCPTSPFPPSHPLDHREVTTRCIQFGMRQPPASPLPDRHLHFYIFTAGFLASTPRLTSDKKDSVRQILDYGRISLR